MDVGADQAAAALREFAGVFKGVERDAALLLQTVDDLGVTINQVCDEIRRLRADNVALRAALELAQAQRGINDCP